jgi:beta-glucosidase
MKLKNIKTTCLLLVVGATAFAATPAITQPVLESKSAKIITIDGLQFKDLNKNGKLDKYEDWRLPYSERAKDLLSKMTLEEKAGMMLISTTRLENDWSFEKTKTNLPITSNFNEEDLVMKNNMLTGLPMPVPQLSAAGTTNGVRKLHLRNFILRANADTRILAEWSNKLQALCESDGLGIPAIVTSNPRNHITKDASIGLSVGKTTFSTWPGELGLAAMRDPQLVHEFADIARQEWTAIGLRKGYMYMADLATEPRWQRIEGTFGEDATLAAQTMREVVLGFQGNKLSSTSVALTVKHFPGGGSTENGQDPHFPWGKREVMSDKMLQNNLVTFKAAIDAGVSSIMPYYSIPVGTKYEQVAYAYNKGILHDLLRKELGFNGIINSDTGPIDMMPWGVEGLNVTERYKRSQEAGVNLYSGSGDPTELLKAVKVGAVKMKTIDESVYRLLMEKFELGLFENPYVDVEKAIQIVGNPKFQERADLALRKSIVLLRNESSFLPLKSNTKVYFECYYEQKGSPNGTHVTIPAKNNWDITFVKTPSEADVILVWITPGASSALFDSKGEPIYLSVSKNGVNTCYINCLTSKKPTVMVINYSNPWVIDEIYNNETTNVKGVLSTFGATPEALLDIVTGKFNPTAKMPFTTPVSETAAQNQKSDVPGYLKGADYPLFKFGEGMSY